MKINFVIGGLPIHPVSSPDETPKKYKNAPGLKDFSSEDYQKVKALEINPEFENEIIKTRKKLGIPDDGLKYEDYLKLSFTNETNLTNKRVNSEVERIIREFECDSFVIRQLKPIILASIVLPNASNPGKLSGISIQSILEENDLYREENINNEKAVFIKITSAVLPEAIINFIKEPTNRDVLSTLLKNLPKNRKINLEERKLQIFGMKQSGKKTSYEIMAAKMALSSDNEKDNKGGLTFGQDYRRKIKILFHKKRQKIPLKKCK